jgi:hypothetical protein
MSPSPVRSRTHLDLCPTSGSVQLLVQEACYRLAKEQFFRINLLPLITCNTV